MPQNFYPLYNSGELSLQSESVLRQIYESNEAPTASLTPEQARENFLEKSWLGNPDAGVTINDMSIETPAGKIPLRIYKPAGNKAFPVLLYFHGGGFVLGSPEEFDSFCTYLSAGAGCVVVSAGYRLAPENKYPAAVEDAIAAFNWLGNNASLINGDASRIAVAGDSAGANLSAVVSLIAREKPFPKLAYQVLICPWVNLSSTNTDSYKYFGKGLWLSEASIYWYRNHYLANDEQALEYFASPLLVETLSGVPPAFILTAEFDVLRDEGEAYANRLKAESIPVEYKCYKGMLHDFVVMPEKFELAKKAIEDICTELRKAFYK